MASQSSISTRRRKSVRHVSFAGLEDRADDSPRRVYPPTPTRFSRLEFEFEERYPNWKKYLAIFSILTCIGLGLAADYAVAKNDQTPAFCYLPGWENLDRCPRRTTKGFDKVFVEARDVDVPATGGVLENGFRCVEYLYEIPMFVEGINKARHSLQENGHEFVDVATTSYFMQYMRSTNDSDSTKNYVGAKTARLQEMLFDAMVSNLAGTESLVYYGLRTVTDTLRSLQEIVPKENLRPKEIEKLIREGIRGGPGVESYSLSYLRDAAVDCLNGTESMLLIVSALQEACNVMAHPSGTVLNSDKLEFLEDAEYWWTQQKDNFKSHSGATHTALATYFSDLVKLHELLEENKERQEELIAVLRGFENFLKAKLPLLAGGKLSGKFPKEWLPTLTDFVEGLEGTKQQLKVLSGE